MAFGIKYQLQAKDKHQLLWKINILEDGYTGSIITLTGLNNFIDFEPDSGDDDLRDPIKGSFVNINVLSSTNFALADLYSYGHLHFAVDVYQNNIIYWTGWVDCGKYEEPYEDVPYPVKIVATDGLSLLKDVSFTDDGTDTGTPFAGRTLHSESLLDVLGLIGFTKFTEYCNIYETNMNSGTGDSPFDQLKIDLDVFVDKKCDEILAELLKPFGAFIKQYAGVFCIVRPAELKQSAVYGRAFTTPTVKTSVTLTPAQYIKRTGHATDILQVPGGKQWVIDPAKLVNLNQDYGNKDSWIDNWDMKSSTYDPVTHEWNGWTRNGGMYAYTPKYFGLDSDEGMVLITHNTSPARTKYMSQTFATQSLITTDILNFSVDYEFYNGGAADETGVHFYISISFPSKHLYIYDGDLMGWENTLTTYIDLVGDAPKGESGWITLSRRVNTLPAAGTAEIRLYGTWDSAASIWPVVKNIKFYSSSDKINSFKVPSKWWHVPVKILTVWKWGTNIYPPIKVTDINKLIVQKTYSHTNAINGQSCEYNVLLGDVYDSDIDNVLEQFAGSLAVYYQSGYTGAIDKVDEVTKSTYPANCNITCGGLTHLLTWGTNATLSMQAFVTSWAAAYGAIGITLSNGAATKCRFTASFDFTAASTDGTGSTAANITPYYIGDPAYVIQPSHLWNTRTPGGENALLLQIVTDEIGADYARARQIIQMAIHETANYGTAPNINMIGNLRDILNINPDMFNVKVIDASWDIYHSTLALSGGYARYTTTGTDSNIIKQNTLSIDGNANRDLAIRYKVVSGTPTNSQIYYTTAGHGRSGSYYNNFTLIADGAFHTVIIDMNSLTAGGADWITNTITKIWFDLTDAHPVVIDIDFIGFARVFGINAGKFDVEQRGSSLDLIEIL